MSVWESKQISTQENQQKRTGASSQHSNKNSVIFVLGTLRSAQFKYQSLYASSTCDTDRFSRNRKLFLIGSFAILIQAITKPMSFEIFSNIVFIVFDNGAATWQTQQNECAPSEDSSAQSD